MVLIDDTQSKEIQRIYFNLYNTLLHHKPLIPHWHIGDEASDNENNEENKESTTNSHSPQISLSKKGKDSSSEDSPSLLFQVFQNQQLIDETEVVEGQLKPRKITSSSERLLGQVEILQSLPEGTAIPTAPSIQVQAQGKRGDNILSTQTILETDEQGKITKNVFTNPQKSGTQVIREHLSSLEANSVVQYLDELIQTRPQAAIDPDLLAATSQREKARNNPNWWQQWPPNNRQLTQNWQQQYRQKQAAKRLYHQFHQQVTHRQSHYSENGYTLVRQPIGFQQRYTFSNPNNQPILTFEVDSQNRLSIIDSQLSQDDYQTISRFGKNSSQNNQVNELLRKRANNLADKFVALAQGSMGSIRKTGEQYSFTVDPNGEVEISALDGRGVIYHRTPPGNQTLANNLMTDEDLTFFERQLPEKQQSSDPQQQPPHTTPKTVARHSRRRR